MSECKSCSWGDQIKNFGQAMGRAASQAVNGKQIFVSKFVAESRQKICGDCEFKDNLRCKLCGCFISAKTTLVTEVCPEGKW